MNQLLTKYKGIIIALLYIFIFIWSIQYFSTPLLNFERDKYKITNQTEYEIKLESATNIPIDINIAKDTRVLTIQNEQYTIEKNASTPIYNHVFINPVTYDVTYPNGHKYQVQQGGGDFFLVYREDRSLYNSSKEIYNEYDPKIEMYEQELYHPEHIVKAAYTQFYSTQGTWWIFFISLILMTYSCLLLLSRRVQMFVFHLEHGLDVVNPEPTESYFVRMKISAVVFILLAAAIFYKAL